ncbi:hypothetical protein J437_LFUL003891 [Ladona fulva]|uniref:Pentatricopeptide repeat-containing protein 2, mitochondrial n=1 Tax=Ladona fulva TaxID=123851 RepID=A0A8K0K9K9_LADFU|nr:hypothetical protein J437_LFUL003891 [Ladona fulva]
MLCRFSKNLFTHSFNQFCFKTSPGLRGLFANSALGIDGYLKARERVKIQFMDLTDNFKMKMMEFTEPNSKNMIFTEDLKSMVHLCENKPDDVELVLKMIKRFNSQNKELRFGSFIFGPVVLRALHHLNQPKVALQAFKDPELDGFFDQIVSYCILMDLLFKNEMYKEVVEVFDIVSTKQMHGAKYPRNAVILFMAACYKINSKEYFDYAMNAWKKLQELGHNPVRRAVTFAAALAINQNSPHIALEILSCTQQLNYITVRNLKVAALADLRRPEDALPILRNVLEQDNPEQKKQTFTKDVMQKLKVAATESSNKEVVKEFTRLEKMLTEGEHISDKVLDDHLCSEITQTNVPGRVSDEFNQGPFSNYSNQGRQSFQRIPPRHYRQSLKDME